MRSTRTTRKATVNRSPFPPPPSNPGIGKAASCGTAPVKFRYIQGAAKPTRKANGDIVWDGLILDITERKQAEENLRAKEEAERTNKEKSKFLSRMSHELRTPLNAILGFGQVLTFSDLEEQDALALSYILKGGQHLLSLIDEVLDLSRAETGELHVVSGEVDAAEVAGECVGLVARLAEARGITCTVKNSHGPWCSGVTSSACGRCCSTSYPTPSNTTGRTGKSSSASSGCPRTGCG